MHFNCTIQELKQEAFSAMRLSITYFNCTIQELKHEAGNLLLRMRQFQLHHTGIKTTCMENISSSDIKFQLHHTGIKTAGDGGTFSISSEFQLHHTGIKTRGRQLASPHAAISIAPYRN